jgi:hypothetical protein
MGPSWVSSQKRDVRGALLFPVLAFAQLPPRAPELQLLHRWLDSWRGVGAIVRGMQRVVGYDLQLTGYGNGHWRATFWKTETTPPVLGASAYEAAPWAAVQRAAWVAVKK